MKKTVVWVVVFLFALLVIGCDDPPSPPPGATFKVNYLCFAEGSYGYPPIDNNRYQHGTHATVLGKSTLVWAGHTFNGWNTRANGLGTLYKEGEKILVNRDIFLYAMWEKD
jgi:hypothetical protein